LVELTFLGTFKNLGHPASIPTAVRGAIVKHIPSSTSTSTHLNLNMPPRYRPLSLPFASLPSYLTRAQPPSRAFNATVFSRHFSSSPSPSHLDLNLNNLRVNLTRLLTTLHETCAFGPGARWGPAPTETGMSRLALSDADRQARDWFVETTRGLGCEVQVDQMGNVFAV